MSTAPDRTSRRIATSRVTRRPPRLPAVLMAMGVLFFLGYVFFLRTPPEVPVPDLDAVQGTYIWTSQRPTANGDLETTATETGTYSAVASGNAGGSVTAGAGTAGQAGSALESVYDAGARRQADRVQAGDTWRYETTVGAWPPVWRLATRGPLEYQGLAAVVRSVLEDDDRAVGTKVVSDGGRRAWRAAMTFAGDDLVELVVDQASGLVTWCSETTPEASEVFTYAPAWADPPPPEKTYQLSDGGVPDSASVAGDATFEYMSTLGDVRAAAAWGPLASDLAPDGFAERAVATTDADLRLAGQLIDDLSAAPPVSPDEDCVAVLYTRGLTWFTVEQYGPKATRFYEDALGSTLEDVATRELSFERATLQYGWFKGLDAYTWYEKSGPTLFVSGRHRMAYITGALTRQELVSFAEGLEPLE